MFSRALSTSCTMYSSTVMSSLMSVPSMRPGGSQLLRAIASRRHATAVKVLTRSLVSSRRSREMCATERSISMA
ncbi:PP145 [Orf virus]|uniref:PP145 n=1 Tax=Orf virus TaxID=10258 RepID=F1AWV7_ORFV|nr:PP145 [Orf virus]